jgi:hypothetical protein
MWEDNCTALQNAALSGGVGDGEDNSFLARSSNLLNFLLFEVFDNIPIIDS